MTDHPAYSPDAPKVPMHNPLCDCRHPDSDQHSRGHSVPLDMGFESSELFAPEPLRLFQPHLQLCHRLRPERIYAYSRIEVWMRFLNQAALAQYTQVTAHRRRQALAWGQVAK